MLNTKRSVCVCGGGHGPEKPGLKKWPSTCSEKHGSSHHVVWGHQGVPSSARAGAAGPASASEMKDALKPSEVKALAVNAKTPVEHMELTHQHTQRMAGKHDAEAKEHETLAVSADAAGHCGLYAQHCRKAAPEIRAMATAHEAWPKTRSRGCSIRRSSNVLARSAALVVSHPKCHCAARKAAETLVGQPSITLRRSVTPAMDGS